MKTPSSRAVLCAFALFGVLFFAGGEAAAETGADAARAKAELVAKLAADINKVDHAIGVTKDIIKGNPDALYLPELHFRLAELYVERSRYVYARLMEQQPEGAAVLEGNKAIEVQISKRMAIETYTKILTDYQEYEKNDQVRFFRAHEHRELGEWDEMISQLNELIAKYPKSEWAIEARLILADYHFDKGELPAAEVLYKGIVALDESHLHDMARYKLGWIRINQEKYAEALKLFEQAVTSGDKRRGAVGDAHKLDVKREALLAMAWPFSEARKAAQAIEYFRKLASNKTLYVEALKRLANRYFAKTEYMNSALLYREIVALSSDPEQNMEYVQRIDESVRSLSPRDPRKYEKAAVDVEAIVDTVGSIQNHWKFAEQEKGQILRDFELRARDLATKLHVEAQRRGDVDSARQAALAYRQYLSLYGEEKESKAIRLNRAEALYQARDFVEAGEQYEEMAKVLQDGPERRGLLYSAIMGFFNALEDDAVARGPAANVSSAQGAALAPKTGERGKGRLLDSWHMVRAREGLKQIGAYYVRAWPKDGKTPNVKFNVAKMHYLQGGYEKAAELFTSFVEDYPEHQDAVTAANLALDCHNRLDDYAALAALAKRFINNPRIKDTKFKNEASRLAEAASRRRVEMTVMSSGDGDFSERMLSEWEKHKGEKEGEDFLYAGFMKLVSEGNVAGVFDFGGRLLGAYPESPRAQGVLTAMAAFAVRAADFERAAAIYEEQYRRFPASQGGISALNSAASIRYMLGDLGKATEHYRVLRTRARGKEKREAGDRLLEILKGAQSWGELASTAQAIAADTSDSVVAVMSLGLAYSEQGKPELAARELGRAAKMRAGSEVDKDAQAQAMYALARLYQREFDALELRDTANADAVLQRKIELLGAAEQIYVQAVSAGRGEWAIASLQELGRLYRGFSKLLAKAPIPDGLSAADRRSYEQQIGQQVKIYEGKASEIVKACAAKAEQLKVFTAHAAACMAQSFDAVVSDAKRHRGRSATDDASKNDINTIRQNLAKTPESVEALKQLGRRAIEAGDYHLARLVLDKATELAPNDGVAANLWGVAMWSLGEPQEAFNAFERAVRQRSTPAAANLAALCTAYGFTKMAQRYQAMVGGLGAADLRSADYHPSVARPQTEGGGT